MSKTARIMFAVVPLALLGCGGSGGGAAVSGGSAAGADTVQATLAPTEMALPNPERGFFGAAGDLAAVAPEELRAEAAEGFTLLRSYVRLDAFIDRDLTDDFLAALSAGFTAAREAGVKVVLRFSYNDPEDDFGSDQLAQDASIEQALRHIEQLAPMLRDNADVIAFFEAGFIGAWGEWHSSASGLDQSVNRLRIRDALLAALPDERFVLFRSPPDLLAWFGASFDATAAFGATASARAGHHNDCFLSDDTDVGTYPNDQPELRAMVAGRAAYVPSGGETCDGAAPRSACSDVLAEGRRYAMTYLNAHYFRPAFHERWARDGCLPEVARSLGYRLALETVRHPRAGDRGVPLAFAFGVRNDGWAPLYNRRDLTVLLTAVEGDARAEVTVAGVDPRRWSPSLPGETVADVTGSVILPHELPPGDYDVWIGLPDRDARLAGDPRYAIRFANAEQPALGQSWSPARGRFALGTRLTVR
ncbi:MAG: DUF4832 domain-containing protein [Lautropia sp.]